MLPFKYNDGGRVEAGYKGKAGDCVCRAIAIAAGLPYQTVYDRLAEGNASQRRSKRVKGGAKLSKTAREGIHVKRQWFKDYMAELGFVWTPTMKVGEGCKVHLAHGEVPMTGRHVVHVSKHSVALVDGVIHDTHNPSRGGKRCVYGYWTLAPRAGV